MLGKGEIPHGKMQTKETKIMSEEDMKILAIDIITCLLVTLFISSLSFKGK